jgi:hypothetical protein
VKFLEASNSSCIYFCSIETPVEIHDQDALSYDIKLNLTISVHYAEVVTGTLEEAVT